jgi:hypothetical protein
MRHRNILALGILFTLISLAVFAQSQAKKAAQTGAAAPPAQVNVNCQAPGVYKRHTHTYDALQVNFRANGDCTIKFGNDKIFGMSEAQLHKNDNPLDIYDTGITTVCVGDLKCPPDASKGPKIPTGSDPNEIIVP